MHIVQYVVRIFIIRLILKQVCLYCLFTAFFPFNRIVNYFFYLNQFFFFFFFLVALSLKSPTRGVSINYCILLYSCQGGFFSRCQPRILVKNNIANFLFVCFRMKWALKQCLTIIQLQKSLAILDYKVMYFMQSPLFTFFSQGLTHVLSKNWKFHFSLFLDKMGLEKMSDDSVQLKKKKTSLPRLRY